MDHQRNEEIELQTQQEQLLQIQCPPPAPPAPLWFSKRFLVGILMFVCFVNVSFIRYSISIAVVEMTSAKSIKKHAEFNWDSTTIGTALGALYYGELFSWLGGCVKTQLGSAINSALCLMVCGWIILFLPVCLYLGFYTFIAFRGLTGLFEGLMLGSMSKVLSIWISECEKAILMPFVVNGLYVGVFIVYSFSAFLADEWGWSVIFHCTGAIAIITSIVFLILISEKELAYPPRGNTAVSMANIEHPYKSILLSTQVWAIIFCQFIVTWVWSILTTLIPFYIKDVSGGDINKVGLISSFLNIGSILMLPIICIKFLDYITTKFDVSQTKMNELTLIAAFIIEGVLFVSSAIISNFIVSLICFILIQISQSVVFSILQIQSINLVPGSSNVIAGMCTFANALSNIWSCELTGSMITNHKLEEWNYCFFLAGGMLFFGAAIVFALYGLREAKSRSSSSPRRSQNAT